MQHVNRKRQIEITHQQGFTKDFQIKRKLNWHKDFKNYYVEHWDPQATERVMRLL